MTEPVSADPKNYRVCWQHRQTGKISCSPWLTHGEATARIERVICSTQHTYWLERKPDDHSAIVGILREIVADCERAARKCSMFEARVEFVDLIIRARDVLAEYDRLEGGR